MSCTQCPLHKKCKNPFIMGRGSRPGKAKYMIVQEFPTFQDDKAGQILTMNTSSKLNYHLERAGIKYREVYATSAVKCSVKKSSDIKNKQMEVCREYLLAEILKYKPKVIILMGKWGWQALTGNTSVGPFAGHFDNFELEYEVGNEGRKNTFKTKIIATHGLSGSIKAWENNDDIDRHFSKAKKYVEEDFINKTPNPTVNTILTREGLDEFYERMRTVKFAATDFETTGFDFFRDKIINAGYCSKVGEADVVFLQPYKREHIAKWPEEDVHRARLINRFLKENKAYALKTLRRVNGLSSLRLILHNGKFDSKFATHNGIPYKNFFHDTLLASPLIDENPNHSLNLCLERNGIDYGAYDTELWKWINKDEKNKKSYQFVPATLLEKYLGVDVDGDFRLFLKQHKQLKELQLQEHFYKLKMPSLRNMTTVEYHGVEANKELILDVSSTLSKAQSKLNEEFVKITGDDNFNPNSDKQVCEFMLGQGYPFKKLNVRETKNGFSVAKDELEKFMKFKKWKEFPQLLLNAKKLTKLKGTYVDGKDGRGGMLQYLDQKNRIHANFNMWTPVTSRYSCNKPSLQVWPRPIKGLPNTRNFLSATTKNVDEEWVIWEADYSQLEQCVVAALSGDPILTKKIQDGTDLHCFNAAELGRTLGTVPEWVTYEHMLVANGKEDSVTDQSLLPQLKEDIESPEGQKINWKEKRTQAKNIGFGLNYGKGAHSFAEEFGISEMEAEEMVQAYFGIYEGMYNWRESIVNDATTKGYIELLSGRRRRFTPAVEWLNSEHAEGLWSTKMVKEGIERQAMNFPVQGGAHEVFEPACLRLLTRMKKEGLQARQLLSIHDGIIGECPRSEMEMVQRCINEEMPHVFHKGTDLEMSLKIDIDFYEKCWYGDHIKI